MIRSLLNMAQKRTESAAAKKPLAVADWPRIHRHYTTADTCEHGERLNDGWLELGMEAENAQQLLDFVGIPDGDPQGRGDVDWRTADAVLQLMDASGRLAGIASAHARETAPGGMVGDYCVECGHRWPCSTYRWSAEEGVTANCTWELGECSFDEHGHHEVAADLRGAGR
ncbi:MAG: hypothetical protein M3042_10225 [Actinomycetota bacterium]|nr:hypothetical protein [Actinomycetota bacterium]